MSLPRLKPASARVCARVPAAAAATASALSVMKDDDEEEEVDASAVLSDLSCTYSTAFVTNFAMSWLLLAPALVLMTAKTIGKTIDYML